MKRLTGIIAAALTALLFAVSAGAAQSGVTVEVQDGYTCDYGINIPFTRTGRSSSYTFEIYPGDTAAGSPEVRAEVEVRTDSPVTVFLPLLYDVTGPSRYTLKVTAHVLPGREAFDREGVVLKTFDTTPSCGCAAGTAGAYYVGDGVSTPYRILNQAQLVHMQSHLGASLQLQNDLTLSGDWTPIGVFTGVFDGGGHMIGGLSSSKGGLFADISGATIKNVELLAPHIAATSGAASGALGALSAYSYTSEISNCSALQVEISSAQVSFSSIGGLVGHAIDCTVSSCKVTGTVTGKAKEEVYAGGVAGGNATSSYIGCLSFVSFPGISAAGIYTGGIVGVLSGHTSPIIMQNCHWTSPSWAVGRSSAKGGNFTPNSGESFGNSQVSSIEGLS